MVLTGSLRRRIAYSNRRRLNNSVCGKRSEKKCTKNKRCIWRVGKKRSFCRTKTNRKLRTFKKKSIFYRKKEH